VTGPLIADLAADGHDATVVCRLLGVPRSSYYAWSRRWSTPTDADVAEAYLANIVFDIHEGSRGCYGAPRVHAELTLGLGLVINRKKTARLLRLVDRQGLGRAQVPAVQAVAGGLRRPGAAQVRCRRA